MTSVSGITPWVDGASLPEFVRGSRQGLTVPMHDVDRAIADREEEGFVKIHVREGTDTILGATILARHAGDMINGISLAMVAGIG